MSRPPELIDDLAEVPELWRAAYQPAHGRLRLDPELAVMAEACLAFEAEAAERLAQVERDHQRYMAAARLRVIGNEVNAALRSAGARPELLDAATALLRLQVSLRLIEDDPNRPRVVAAEHGAELPFVVSSWLESDAGRPYAGRRQEHAPGRLTGQIRALRPQ
jgi:hypothetical protein